MDSATGASISATGIDVARDATLSAATLVSVTNSLTAGGAANVAANGGTLTIDRLRAGADSFLSASDAISLGTATTTAGNLSGGEQQQLAIARVLLARPRLLLMDEPTEGIQPSVILQIEDAIGRIRERGIAVLLVEQYLEFAWRLADSYAVMRKGAIVASGATADLRHDAVRQHLTV